MRPFLAALLVSCLLPAAAADLGTGAADHVEDAGGKHPAWLADALVHEIGPEPYRLPPLIHDSHEPFTSGVRVVIARDPGAVRPDDD